MLLFARARDLAGAGRVEMKVDIGSSPESVFAALCQDTPPLAAIRDRLRCAIDDEYCRWDDHLRDGAELAFIPPTAGG